MLPNAKKLLSPVDARNIIRAYIYMQDRVAHQKSFIKVGANDGVTGDPCGNGFLKAKRWNGVLIEPIPYVFERLKSVYCDTERFRCLQVAVSNQDGKATIYFVSEAAQSEISDLPVWWNQIASFVPGHIEKHIEGRLTRFIQQTEVEALTLRSLMRLHKLECPSFLHIDTEGHDLEVLKSYDFGAGSPEVVLIEHQHLSDSDSEELAGLLRSKGYKTVFKTRFDLLAFQRSLVAWGCFLVAKFAVAFRSSVTVALKIKRMTKMLVIVTP
jgi:FkbM family methyltransferase